MEKFRKIDAGDIWWVGVFGIIAALPITLTLGIGGLGYLRSAVTGVLVGLFISLVFLSEEYKFLRIICALIGTALALLICNHTNFSWPVNILVVGAGTILGFFARKWVEFIWYIN